MLTREQIDFKKSVVEFAKKHLSYDIKKNDYAFVFNREAWRKCAEYGVQGWIIPKEYGGQDLSMLTAICGMEGLGYACLDDGLIFGMNAHVLACAMPILNFGTNEQKSSYLPPMCNGDIIASHSATEPLSGSDIYSLQTTAQQNADGYVLNGEKRYVTNGAVADLFIIFALSSLGVSAFLVPRGTPGLQVGPIIETMGERTAGVCRLKLENCLVKQAQLLGNEGNGELIFASSMELERGFILARAIGSMERLLERSVKYARSRKQFGQPISNFQHISGKLVNMKMRLESSRMHLYNLAVQKDNKKSVIMEAAMTKLYISESWVEVSMNAMEIHGGNGYMVEYDFEREFRNAMGSKFYSGTTEIQKNVIAKFMGL